MPLNKPILDSASHTLTGLLLVAVVTSAVKKAVARLNGVVHGLDGDIEFVRSAVVTVDLHRQ